MTIKMWDANSTLDDSKEISHKMENCIIFAIVAVVVTLFWNKDDLSPGTSYNKLSMLSFCVVIIMIIISLTNSSGSSNSSEKVRDYHEVNDMMNEITVAAKSECVVEEEEVPADEVKFICRAEDICIHESEVGSFSNLPKNSDNHKTVQKKMREKRVSSSHELNMAVEVADHDKNKSELVAFNKRVDDFIAKFNGQIRLEAQQSSSRRRQILPAGRYIKAL